MEITVENTNKQKGASLVEYALLVALIAVVALVAIRTVGTAVSTRFSDIEKQLTDNTQSTGATLTSN